MSTTVNGKPRQKDEAALRAQREEVLAQLDRAERDLRMLKETPSSSAAGQVALQIRLIDPKQAEVDKLRRALLAIDTGLTEFGRQRRVEHDRQAREALAQLEVELGEKPMALAIMKAAALAVSSRYDSALGLVKHALEMRARSAETGSAGALPPDPPADPPAADAEEEP